MLSEAETRKRLVEKALVSAGWSPTISFSSGRSYEFGAVREYETDNGPADYILFIDGIAVAESKRLELGPQNVLVQAQRYSRGYRGGPYNFGGFRVPFVYSTNGEVFWFQDLRDPRSRSRQVAGFHTSSALKELLGQDLAEAEQWLKGNPIDNPFLRPYQKEAIESVEGALLAHKRRMLLAMATGTGKTRVATSLVYRLLKSGFAKRILFLVDRRALAAQAVKEFSTFEPEPGLKFDRIYEVYSQRFRREDLDEEVKFDPKVLPVGTVLFSSRASIGKIAIAGTELATNQGFANIIPGAVLDPKYLAYGLRNFTKNIERLGSGTTYLEIAKSSLKEFYFPLAPLKEQRRIVSKIEGLRTEGKIALEALDKIPGLLRRFRQSVLIKAFRGELTQRDPSDEPARELLEKIKQERQKRWNLALIQAGRDPQRHKYREARPVGKESCPDLPTGWEWTTFETVCWEITVGHVGPMASEYIEDGIPFLRSLNVRENRFDPKNLKYVSEKFHKKLSKSHLSTRDIVVVRSGNVGISCVIPETMKEANCSDLVIARPVNGFLSEYGSLFINSILARDQINTMKVGIAQTHFNIGSMKKILIPLAPYDEQKRIVAKVLAFFSIADNIETASSKARTRTDRVDRAVLAKAFRGDLVPQDPNDESASIMLERITSASKFNKDFQKRL